MSDSLGFLIADVGRLIRRNFDVKARVLGATRQQWRVLKLLERQEGVNQGRIAEMLEVEPITLSRMIDRLQESGLVERRPDPKDRRAWQLYLTEQAAPVLAQLKTFAEALLDEALEGLASGEREQLTVLLTRVQQNLSRVDEEWDMRDNG
jgi:DNA-binding MarR family transcriptional regulator